MRTGKNFVSDDRSPTLMPAPRPLSNSTPLNVSRPNGRHDDSLVSRWMLALAIYIMGGLLNGIGHLSWHPMAAGFLLGGVGLVFLTLPRVGGKFERLTFIFVFSVCWMAAGLTSLYDDYYGDKHHNGASDAVYFADIVSGGSFKDLDFGRIMAELGENGGAMIVWIVGYDWLTALGFERAPYIGIALNSMFVALAGVVGVKMCHCIFPNDGKRALRFLLIFSLCGNFWLLGSIHIRDALVLLAVTLLTLFWVRLLEKPGVLTTIAVLVASTAAALTFGSLRTELAYVPLAMTGAGIAAIAFTYRMKAPILKLAAVVISIGLIGMLFLSPVGEMLGATMAAGKDSYTDLSWTESGDQSLGNRLIVSQVLPVRVVFGSVYLLTYPIPFWVGFTQRSSYHMFKTLNAVFMYGFLPLLVLSITTVMRAARWRRPSIVFLLIMFAGFTVGIATTSMETRHISAFFVSAIVVALIPNLAEASDRQRYQRLLSYAVVCVIGLHIAWRILKG